MKAIMLSIPPEDCELILNGKKTIEVRKTAPKLKPPFKCYIYCTNEKHKGNVLLIGNGGKQVALGDYRNAFHWKHIGNGNIIGEFVCKSIDKKRCDNGIAAYFNNKKETCLSDIYLMWYAEGKPLYFYYISELKIYDKPKELGEFKRLCKQYNAEMPLCDDCNYFINCKGYEYDESDCGVNGFIPITRPPTSWCYVEELKQ